MTKILSNGAFGGPITEAFFGANILSTRDRLDADGTYAAKVDDLGVGPLRYPGGSITEYYFDITDPDRATASHHLTGETIDTLPFSDFMQFAEDSGRSVLIVLPTRNQLHEERDANGDRFAAVEEDALRTFLKATLDGDYGFPVIDGFEIGNEYARSGEMTSTEYGRVAAQMTEIVDQEIQNHPEYEELFSETAIHVQMGHNYGAAKLDGTYQGTAEQQLAQFMSDYDLDIEGDFISSAGGVVWTKLANHQIMREFELTEGQDRVDGITAHIYSRGEDNISSQSYEMRMIAQTWGSDDSFEDARPIVTEWNIKNPRRDPEEDFGLIQAGQMLDIVEIMGFYEVSSAYVWPIQQNSQSSLTGNEGETNTKVGGAFFKMMSEALPGTQAINLMDSARNESEVVIKDAEVHAFAGEDRAVFYIQSLSDEDTLEPEIDISAIVAGFDSVGITKLGVAPGDSVGSSSATPVLSELDPAAHYANGLITGTLSPREIMQITFEGVEFAPEMDGFFPARFAPEDDASAPPPITEDDAGNPVVDETLEERAARELETAEETPEDAEEDGGSMGDMMALLLLIPLLAVGAAAY